jgi:hypothetical protein
MTAAASSTSSTPHPASGIRAVARVEVIDWRTVSSDADQLSDGRYLRLVVRRAFRGDVAGESTGELRVYIMDPDDDHHYVYVASDRVTAVVGDRSGTFLLEYWGVNGTAGVELSGGHIVPGSGTGALAGISGTLEISGDGKGPDTFVFTLAGHVENGEGSIQHREQRTEIVREHRPETGDRIAATARRPGSHDVQIHRKRAAAHGA